MKFSWQACFIPCRYFQFCRGHLDIFALLLWKRKVDLIAVWHLVLWVWRSLWQPFFWELQFPQLDTTDCSLCSVKNVPPTDDVMQGRVLTQRAAMAGCRRLSKCADVVNGVPHCVYSVQGRFCLPYPQEGADPQDAGPDGPRYDRH